MNTSPRTRITTTLRSTTGTATLTCAGYRFGHTAALRVLRFPARWSVVDLPTGHILTTHPMSEEDARRLAEAVASQRSPGDSVSRLMSLAA